MYLDIGAEFQLTVTVVFNLEPNNKFSGAQGVGYAISGGKGVQPEYAGVDELNGHASWYACEWKHVVCAPSPFLDSTNVAFYFRDMLIPRNCVECNSHPS
jgi:hypothetical protein